MGSWTPTRRDRFNAIIRIVIGVVILAISSSQELFAQAQARLQASARVVSTPVVMEAQKVTKTASTLAFLEAQLAAGDRLAGRGQHLRTTIGPAVITVRMSATDELPDVENGVPMDGPWSTLPVITTQPDVHILVEFSAN